ncbi:conserved hypothetical protein [Candidatus Magnetomoraceae bacterium gMMP-1]
MKKFNFAMVLVLFFCLTGCAGLSFNIGPIEAFSPINLERSEVMPSQSELRSSRYKVAVLTSDHNGIKAAENAKLGQTVATSIEGLLRGNVELISRERSAKLKREILLAEERGVGDWEGDSLADYVIYSKITNASLNHKFQEASSWTDDEGKKYYIPPEFTYTANVAGSIKIYKIPEMNVLKVINFDDNAQRYEETRSSRTHRRRDDNLIIKAAKDAIIHQAKFDIINFFSPKGYILRARKKGSTYIFETTLGRDKVKQGDKVQIFTSKMDRHPLSGKYEKIETIVADGKVSEHTGNSRSWIIVNKQDNGVRVRVGDYVKVKIEKGFSDYLNEGIKTLNQLTQ